MVFHQVESSAPVKMSFAKVVAMSAPNVAPALPSLLKENKSKLTTNPNQTQSASRESMKQEGAGRDGEIPVPSNTQPEQSIEQVRSAIEGLGLVRDRSSTVQHISSISTGDSFRDDHSNLSGSQAEQQNFETKSMTSVTTFAMDEKESIRPDDSASVRAADDDEPHVTFGRSLRPPHGIEQPIPSQRSVMRVVAPGVTIATRRYPGMALVNPPRFGNLPVEPTAGVEEIESSSSTMPVEPVTGAHSPNLVTSPDEKLLDALASLKDRLPLLLLEEKLVIFVTQTNDDVLELPPQNSFTRLLTHKLADYYNLAHQVSEDNTSVRIFRTRFTHIPTPLAEIARAINIGPQQASTAAHVKIMRRVQLGRGFSAANSTAASSSVASKATSENGAETNSEEGLLSPVEATSSRDKSKLSREEREAQYKAARERIFGDFQESVTSESGSTGETSTSMSRSSSSSGKKKSRKHKTPRDDSFEARSAFTASYAPTYMQTGQPQAYSEMQFPGAYSKPTSNYGANMYGPVQAVPYDTYDPNMSYRGSMSPGRGMNQSYVNNEAWQNMQQISAYNYPQAAFQQQTHMRQQFNVQYPQTQQINMSVGWAMNQTQNPYQQSQNVMNAQWTQYGQQANVMQYQYGQLPSQNYHAATVPTTQHPVPGSHGSARSLFNPQTRSFVPGGNPGRANSRNSRKKGGQTPTTHRSVETSTNGNPANATAMSPKSKEDSLQQKYGTPPNLPKKPPPSQNPSHFISDHAPACSGSIATAAKVVANGDIDDKIH